MRDEACDAELAALQAKIRNMRSKCANISAGKADLVKGLNTAGIVASGVGTAAGAVGSISSGIRLSKEQEAIKYANEEASRVSRGEPSAQLQESLKRHFDEVMSKETFDYKGRTYTSEQVRDRINELTGSTNPADMEERDEFIEVYAGMQRGAAGTASAAGMYNVVKPMLDATNMTKVGFTSSGVALGTSIAGTLASGTSLVTSSVLAGEISGLFKRIDECEAAVRELQ